MNLPTILLKLTFCLAILLCANSQEASASHITSGDLYWECVTTGPDAGKYIMYMTAYRDCSIPGQTITAPQLTVQNCPTLGSLGLNFVSTTDVTPTSCGFSCLDGIEDISVEQFLFASDPFDLPGPPPAQGYVFYYEACCRNDVQNIVNSSSDNFRFSVTMYPYNSQNTSPCFDSSPSFAEKPSSLRCSGYELRYNSNAIDPDKDSLSYSFVSGLGTGGNPLTYQPDYSATQPLPGPAVNPAYDQITLDPVTGQFEYQSSTAEQGSYAMTVAVDAWRCGQRISRTIREMTVSFIACTETNSIPQVTPPVWTSPAATAGFEVTVAAGDLVNFSLEALDPDFNGAVAQSIQFTAAGAQFDATVSGMGGCVTPCATLSNVVPPASATNSISTIFNWQTDCDHVSIQDACANLSNTYNFLFKYEDDFCPASGSNIVNVAITVVGEVVVESPEPHCASTAANGDITLTWVPVADSSVPPSFVEYVIFHSLSPNGPYQEIGTVPAIVTGTYVHNAANVTATPAIAGPNYYYIRTRSGCNDAVLDASIDSIASIFLTVTDNTTTADLAWNALAAPNLSSSNPEYDVWRLEPGGVWMQIGFTDNLFYSDPVIWCADELITYRVELGDNLGCISVSNEVSETLNNPTDPDPQPIDSVTVDPVTGLATICWPPSTSLNVVEYNVYWNPNQFAWNPLSTVVGFNNNCWTDPNPAAQSGSIWYQVTATNNCAREGAPWGSGVDQTDFHQTLFLEAESDDCARSTTLSWNKYRYWDAGVKEYQIYASIDGQTEIRVASTADTVTEFVHENLVDGTEYCYLVRAVKNVSTRVTSTSNEVCLTLDIPKRPEYSYNYRTTVQPGNTGIEEYFYCDNTAEFLGFELQRGTDPSSMSTIWFVPYDATTNYYEYTDPGARPSSQSYYYSLIGIDDCDLPADTVNVSRTIFLEAEPNTNRTNSLQWNPYEGWLGGVAAYNIFRSFDGPFALLTTVPSGQLTYLDSIEDIIIGNGKFCYYIEAVEGIGAPVGPLVAPPEPILFQEMSRSNEACAKQHPNVFMPNAFMPEGVNNVFKPVTVYVEANSYLFQIYSRWGERVFETTNPNDGWNGSHGGKKDPQGAYVYYVQFVSSDGQTYSKSGSVTLIR